MATSKLGQIQVAAAIRNRSIIAARARENPNVFSVFVMRDEKTGKPIKLAPTHERWHALMSKHDRLVLFSHVDSGKTSQISICRVLWELGRDPNLRIAIISKTKNLAIKIVRACGQYIARSGPIHEVFPHLRPTRLEGMPWNLLSLTVERPGGGVSKDPSITACGNIGNIIGARVDLLILDDVLDSTNTRTPEPRNTLYEWIKGTLWGRLAPDARIWVVGNALHPDDAMHRLEKEPRFVTYRFPAIDTAGAPTWPERWPLARIEAAKEEFGPLDYARQMLCQARDDDSARFKREWIEVALSRGVGLQMLYTVDDLRDELASPHYAATYRLGKINLSEIPIYIGVDLAVQQHAAADLTAFVTVALLPDGTRRLLNIESGHWGAPDILKRIEEHNERYLPTAFIVENNGAQDYIVQLVQHHTAIPVVPFTTGMQKVRPEFGIERIANELAAGKWIIPCESLSKMSKEAFGLVGDLLSYEPPPTHTGDRLMGMYFAQFAAARAEARLRSLTGAFGGVQVKILDGTDPPPPAQLPPAQLPPARLGSLQQLVQRARGLSR